MSTEPCNILNYMIAAPYYPTVKGDTCIGPCAQRGWAAALGHTPYTGRQWLQAVDWAGEFWTPRQKLLARTYTPATTKAGLDESGRSSGWRT